MRKPVTKLLIDVRTIRILIPKFCQRTVAYTIKKYIIPSNGRAEFFDSEIASRHFIPREKINSTDPPPNRTQKRNNNNSRTPFTNVSFRANSFVRTTCMYTIYEFVLTVTRKNAGFGRISAAFSIWNNRITGHRAQRR